MGAIPDLDADADADMVLTTYKAFQQGPIDPSIHTTFIP